MATSVSISQQAVSRGGRVAKAMRRQAKPRSGPGTMYFVVLIGLTVCFSLAYVWLRMHRIEVAYELSVNQQREQELDKEHRRLLYTLATLKDPKRLEKIAREDLGMSVPAPGQVIVLEDSPK